MYYQRIGRYGVDGALRLMAMGPDDLDPRFVEALDLFEAELSRLRHEHRVQEVEESRARARKQERRPR